MFEVLRKKIKGFSEKLLKKKATEKFKPELTLSTKIKKVVSNQVTLTRNDLDSALFEFELALLEADVEQETAKQIVSLVEKRLLQKTFSKQFLELEIKKALKQALIEVLETEKLDFFGLNKDCLVILFLGPNGAGKTTTIAKLAFKFREKNKQVILAASDTFRAASIEQLEFHAKKTGSRIVRHSYGSDPAAVAFDAVQAGRATKNSVVLIDTAGRQETNQNLLNELKKIVRVSKPDLKIFVGETYAGNALLEQAKTFDRELSLDGFILTKLDADPKGGTILSLAYNLKKPVLFIGTGQNYSDLKEFDAKKIVERII